MRLFIDFPDDTVTDANLLAANVRIRLHDHGLEPANVQLAPTGDDALEDAKRVLRADYWRAVRDMAEELEGEVKSGELEDQEALDQALWERIDGSYWVTYTHANLQVLCWTEHDDAYEEVLGGQLTTDEGASKVYSQVAFCAMLADVQSYIADDIFDQVKAGASIPCTCGHEREDHFEAGPHGELLICEHEGCPCDNFEAATDA